MHRDERGQPDERDGERDPLGHRCFVLRGLPGWVGWVFCDAVDIGVWGVRRTVLEGSNKGKVRAFCGHAGEGWDTEEDSCCDQSLLTA